MAPRTKKVRLIIALICGRPRTGCALKSLMDDSAKRARRVSYEGPEDNEGELRFRKKLHQKDVDSPTALATPAPRAVTDVE